MILLVIITLLTSICLPQDYRFEHYGIEQGLTQSSVTSITQDARGFLWVATWDGLNRFDGNSFLQFKADTQDSSALRANNIIRIYTLNDTCLLVWNAEGGFSFLNTNTLRFIKHIGFPNSGEDALTYPLITDSGIYAFKKGGVQKITLPDFRESYFKDREESILVSDPKKNLWQIHPGGFNKLSIKGSLVRSYPVPPGRPFLIRPNYDHFFSWMSDSTVLFETEKSGLYILNTATGKYFPAAEFIPDPLIKEIKNINLFFTDSRGRIWVGTYTGLYLIKQGASGYNVTKYVNNPDDPFSLHSNRVQTIYEDQSGIIWVGTTTGLHKIVRNKAVFKHFPPYNSSDLIPYVYLEEKDRLWWGTTNGLFMLDYTSGKTRRFTSENSGLRMSFVYTIYRHNDGNLYLGTRKGLHIMDSSSYQIRYVSVDTIASLGIYSFMPSRGSDLWISASYGLYFMDYKTRKFTRYTPEQSRLLIGGKTILCSFRESDSTLLLGSDAEGLFRFNTNTRKFTDIYRLDSASYLAGRNKIMSIHKDSRGKLRLATLGGGLYEIETEGGGFSYRQLTVRNGFADNSMYGILEDNKGTLWIPTNRGLSRYIPETGAVYNFTTEDGLPSNEFNQNGFHAGVSGRFFFATVGGSVSFYPGDISINTMPPPLAFTKFLIKNEDYSSLLRDTVITLSYSQNFFSIEFAALAFESPSKNQYAYMLEGIDQDWIYSGHRRFANYTEVKPGTYTFRIRGSNGSGIWNNEGTALTIVIVPPFWATWWFRLLMTVAFLSTFAGIILYTVRRRYKEQIKQLERQKELLEERQKIRDKIARDLHDDLASTVGGAGLYVETAKNKFHSDAALSLQYLDKTGGLLREAEDAMSDIVWSVSPRFDTLPNLVSRIHSLAGELSAAASIQYLPDISVFPELPIAAEVRRNIYMIFKEAINNVMRHSGADTLWLSIAQTDGRLMITLTDNGKGLPSSGNGSSRGGNGLNNMKKRAEDLQAELAFTPNPSGGLKVHFSIELTRLGY